MPTTVVNKRRTNNYDVYIGRGSIWGNPFVLGKHGNRASVIAQYRAYIMQKPELLAQVHTLKGKRLACYCAPLPCHGDILAELAEKGE